MTQEKLKMHEMTQKDWESAMLFMKRTILSICDLQKCKMATFGSGGQAALSRTFSFKENDGFVLLRKHNWAHKQHLFLWLL